MATRMPEANHKNVRPRCKPRKPYTGPALVKRDKLSRITGAPAPASGIVVDGAGR
jgi:hypothetical protein